MKKQIKSLGKISSKLLITLSAKDRVIFTVDDALKITNTSLVATRRLLNDLVNKRWLIRLTPGKYLIVPLSAGEKGEITENWYVIAKNLIAPKPYYISYAGALDIHEMTVNPPLTIYISSPIRRIPKKIFGATFRFIYIRPKEMWGLEERWITPSQKVKVSDIERTIIDCLNRPELCGGLSEVAKGLWSKRDNIDYKKLVSYAGKLGKKSIIKRLGFLLETYKMGAPEILADLQATLTRSYSLLDPTLPPTGRYNGAWKLRINLDPAELIEITKT
jgi:predicted transcriptional regulator of viral defense system